jgi:hypothetical protein
LPVTSTTQIGTTLKGRPPLPHGDVCDYPYHKYPGCIVPRKFSHLGRPETRYETMTPGPIYDKPPAIESRAAGIGLRPKSKVDVSASMPGPADYFKTPIPPKELPFCGFYGPSERSGLDGRRDGDGPGPGKYGQGGGFGHPRRGFAFTSRPVKDYVSDTDGSYVAPFSALGGPKWTIGSKDA